jgi:hypothetical protein
VKRWDEIKGEDVEDPRVDAFLAEVQEVSRKHGMSLSHEDGHGSFRVVLSVDEFNLRWLFEASIAREGRQ